MDVNNGLNNIYNKQKKTKYILIAIFIFLIILTILFICIYNYYQNHINVSYLHENNFDCDLSYDYSDNEFNLNDNIEYDLENKNILVTIPKDYLYNHIIHVNEFTNNIKDNYNITVNRIGLTNSLDNKNLLILCSDITYHINPINLNLNAYLEILFNYVFDSKTNKLNIYFNDLVLGKDVDKSIYENYIPFSQNEMIYEIDISKFELKEEYDLNIDNITDINFYKDHVIITLNMMDFLKDYLKNSFDIDNNRILDIIDNYLPYIIDIYNKVK